MSRAAVCLVPLLALCACAGMEPRQPPGIPVTLVVEQLKKELAVFAQDTNGQAVQLDSGCAKPGKPLTMKVATATVKLTTSIQNDTALNAGAEVPIGAVTLGPSGGFSTSAGNSQTVVLNFIPQNPTAEIKLDPKSAYPLANALKGLRDQLVAVKAEGVCLGFDPKDKSTLELAFTAERAGDVGVKLNIVVLSFGASQSTKTSVGNTITVSLDLGGSLLAQ